MCLCLCLKRILAFLDRSLINCITYNTMVPNYDYSFEEILKPKKELNDIYFD